jgi:hypothetical protein
MDETFVPPFLSREDVQSVQEMAQTFPTVRCASQITRPPALFVLHPMEMDAHPPVSILNGWGDL